MPGPDSTSPTSPTLAPTMEDGISQEVIEIIEPWQGVVAMEEKHVASPIGQHYSTAFPRLQQSECKPAGPGHWTGLGLSLWQVEVVVSVVMKVWEPWVLYFWMRQNFWTASKISYHFTSLNGLGEGSSFSANLLLQILARDQRIDWLTGAAPRMTCKKVPNRSWLWRDPSLKSELWSRREVVNKKELLTWNPREFGYL